MAHQSSQVTASVTSFTPESTPVVITEDEKKVAKAVEADQNKKEKWTYTSWADGLEKRTRPEAKKILVVTKPKPIKPLVPLDPLLDYDWRLAPWFDYPEDDDANPEEDKTRIRNKIKTGITKLI